VLGAVLEPVRSRGPLLVRQQLWEPQAPPQREREPPLITSGLEQRARQSVHRGAVWAT